MKRLLLFLLYSLIAPGLNAQSQLPAPPSTISASLSSFTKDFRTKKSGAPGVIVQIYNPGKWEWNYADGISDIANNIAAKPGMVFRTASISKLICATAVLKLVSEKVLTLNDPISKWLDKSLVDELPEGNKITIKDLLKHTSGLSEPQLENAFQEDILSSPLKNYRDTMLGIIAKLSGKTLGYGYYFYSNANFNLLAEVVKRATGLTYKSYLEKKIILPLNLGNTYPDSLPAHNSFWGYIPCSRLPNCNFAKDSLVAYSHANASWATGAADISSTTQDLIKFYQSLQDGKIISKDLVDSMSSGTSQYGLGTMVFKKKGISYAIGHTGTGQCYSSVLSKLIPSNIYICFSFNRFSVGIKNLNDYLYGLNTIVNENQPDK